MRRGRCVFRLAACAMLAAAAVGGGCRRSAAWHDDHELRNPAFAAAESLREAGRAEAAVETLRDVVRRHPDLARAHLALALIADQPGGDLWEAVYHYRRYLELRPESEKRAMIEAQVAAARKSLAGGAGGGSDSGSGAEAESLRRENAQLKEQLEALRRQLRRYGETAPATEPPPAPAASPSLAPAPSPAPSPARPPAVSSYRVKAGDSLSGIASQVYGSADKWKRIYEANREVLRSPESVRAGQLLLIPPPE